MINKKLRNALIGMTFILVFCSQSIYAQSSEVKEATKQENNQRPPQGDERKGPPKDGQRKGPPNGKRGGNPEQAESMDQMKGYKIGEKAEDFNLKNTDGKMVSLKSFKNAKGYIVIFTCNECPYAKFYEDRIVVLNNEYASKGYPVIAINPNSPENPSEGYEAMQTRSKEKGFTFPYLVDEGQQTYPKFGALRTPHVFLLDKTLTVRYIGSIDDNAKSAEDVKVKFVENAIQSLENGKEVNPSFTKAIGCSIKTGSKQ